MIPKFRAFFVDPPKMVEWEELSKFKGLTDIFKYSEDNKLFSLMQATGLQDKNGVDIYEGDIIKTGETLDWLNEDMGVIRFLDGAFFIDYHNLDTEFDYIGNISLPIEIVGNIYENSELLEEQS